jgi:hypothetical protein
MTQARAVVARNLCEHPLLRRASHALHGPIPVRATSRPPEGRTADLNVGFDAGRAAAAGREATDLSSDSSPESGQ